MTVRRSRTIPESEVEGARRLVQTAGLVFYLLAVQGIFTAGVGVYVYLQGGNADDLVLPASGGVLALCYAFVGYNLRRYRLWARNFAFVLAAIGLFFFPVGTVLGAGLVVCLERANRAGLFPSPVPPQASPEAEEAAPLLRFEPDLSSGSAG
jgi:hypothetical protein